MISAEFEDSRTVRPDPFGDKIELYEAPGTVVAVGEEVEVYELRPTAHQIQHVYGEMTSEYSGAVSKVEELSLEQGIEEAAEAVFERI